MALERIWSQCFSKWMFQTHGLKVFCTWEDTWHWSREPRTSQSFSKPVKPYSHTSSFVSDRKGLQKAKGEPAAAAAAAAKSLQSCPTLCDPIDGSPPGSPVSGILQARTLEWVTISLSNAWSEKWKWRCSVVSDSSQPHGPQPTKLLRPWDFPGKSTGVRCHRLLHKKQERMKSKISCNI